MSEIKRNLPNDQYQAAIGANSPSGANPFATLADVGGQTPVVEESIYLENTEWATSSLVATFNFASATDPHTGAVSIETTADMGASNYLSFDNTTEISPGASELKMWWKCKVNMTVPSGKVSLQWYKDDVAVGSSIDLFGSPGFTYGVIGSNTSTYQEAVIPMADFNLSSDVDELRVESGIGPSFREFFLDDIQIFQLANTLPSLDDVNDNILPSSTTNADDGRLLHYSNETKEWVADDIVTHGTLVLNTHSDGAQTGVGGYGIAGQIKKGNPVYLTTGGITNDLQEVGIADASNPNKMPVIGFAAEDILVATTDAKHVIKFGKIQGIDTSGTSDINADSPTVWTVGQDLYISPIQGKLTNQRPQGSTIVQKVAKVLKIGTTDGSLMIINSARAAGLPNLGTGNIWVGDVTGYPVETPIPGGGGGSWNPPKSSLEDWTRTTVLPAGTNPAPLTTLGLSEDAYFFFTDAHTGPGSTLNPTITAKFHLGKENGLDYDGSNLALRIHSQLFGTNGVAGDTVRWETRYTFLADGEDGTSKLATVLTTDVDYSTRTTANGLYTDILATITGEAGAKELRISLTRKNNGGGPAQDYPNDVDFFGIDIIKV